MEEELSEFQPEDLIEHLDNADKWIEETMQAVHAREKDCLKRIFTRFCLQKVKFPDFDKVGEQRYPNSPNLTDYWYMFGTKDQYFLMRAEFKIVAGAPNLLITFNPELAFNNEL